WSELQTHNKSNNFMGEALIGLRRGLGFLELHANAGYMDHQMRRDLTLGESLNGDAYDQLLDCDPADNYYNGVYSVQQTGDYANRILGGGLRLGYQKTFLDKWLFLPTIGINFMDVRNPRGFTEDGPESAAFRLVFGKGGISRTTLRVPLMLRLSRGIAWNRGGPWIFTPEVRFGVTANLLDRGGRADYLWRGNPIRDRWIKAWGIEEDRLSCQAGVTLELSKRGRFFTALNYDYYFQKGSGNHGYSFQAGLNF
ncbi:MAG: autotransporter outer membrane beta-barrel domain-containing protein, partial [Planctomycetota bacterium]|nr:autotransporter outer membrane beta-barrel domain-containing protein [Planctomycetota bacterium]